MNSIFADIFVFLSGLIIGSFLNCVIYRIEQDMDFIKERSICPKCKHVLAWNDLVPLISFLILRGKCRYCGKKISWQYPSVELITAILFVWIFNYFNPFLAIFQALIACLLIIVFIYDLKHFIIPDRVVFFLIGLALLWKILEAFHYGEFSILSNAIMAGLIGFLFFFAIFAVSKGKWMGFGDVKLSIFMGLFLGFPGIVLALFFSFLIGGAIGIALILTKKKGLKSEVPFGPFLITGTFITLFWGEKIISWYLNLLIA